MYVSNDHMRDDDPPGRYRHEIAHDDDNIYIFGGGTQLNSFALDEIPVYNLTENRFRYIKTKPDPQVELIFFLFYSQNPFEMCYNSKKNSTGDR